QGPAVSFSAADKDRVARMLDGLGFDYVEGGFPGSNPKDEELFAGLAAAPLKHAKLAAFGATRRAGGRCEDDANLNALVESGAPVWTLVGKSDAWQVANVLQTTTNENLVMVEESVAYGVGRGREHPGRRDGRRRDGSGNDQRLRRALWQRQPCLGRVQSRAEARVRCSARSDGGAVQRAVADGGRDRQPGTAAAAAVRRLRRLRTQGRAARG